MYVFVSLVSICLSTSYTVGNRRTFFFLSIREEGVGRKSFFFFSAIYMSAVTHAPEVEEAEETKVARTNSFGELVIRITTQFGTAIFGFQLVSTERFRLKKVLHIVIYRLFFWIFVLNLLFGAILQYFWCNICTK